MRGRCGQARAARRRPPVRAPRASRPAAGSALAARAPRLSQRRAAPPAPPPRAAGAAGGRRRHRCPGRGPQNGGDAAAAQGSYLGGREAVGTGRGSRRGGGAGEGAVARGSHRCGDGAGDRSGANGGAEEDAGGCQRRRRRRGGRSGGVDCGGGRPWRVAGSPRTLPMAWDDCFPFPQKSKEPVHLADSIVLGGRLNSIVQLCETE